MRDGRIHITQKADGMNQTTNPSFDYGWVLQRNPRTFAGEDAAGRTMLVTVDGDGARRHPRHAPLRRHRGASGGRRDLRALTGGSRCVGQTAPETGEDPLGGHTWAHLR
ncbi:phosphodiester glycosidase family protein [Arsenicicoccus piscis]|uniref:Phosphodiester glycosidase domain-containing protein n=1 Tax=Arsenicicoccus piscis TaxID=673954 RepID=A0ABQ6HRC8_9MICO|nr:hypothetical protein GCM10025862_22340 [Arsenicicoccus piscis]